MPTHSMSMIITSISKESLFQNMDKRYQCFGYMKITLHKTQKKQLDIHTLYVLQVLSQQIGFSDTNLLVGMGESILELSLSNRKMWRSMDTGLLCSNPITPLSGPLPGPHPCTLVSVSLDSKWLPEFMPRL